MKTFQLLRRTSRSRRSPVNKASRPDGQHTALQDALGYPVQAKLKIGAPNDAHEREADATADRVMAMPDGSVQRSQTSTEPEDEKKKKETERSTPEQKHEEEIQRKETGGEATVTSADAAAIGASQGGGQALPASVRAYFEPRMGANFGRVRIHTDTKAANLSADMSARAFTVGKDVFFGHREYQPGTSSGRHLLAHELAHVMQQSKAAPSSDSMIQRRTEDDLRKEADLPSDRQTPGRLAELETKSRQQADQAFQQAAGDIPLPEGSLGRGNAIIDHVKHEADRLESARANGYQDAVFDMLAMDLSSSNATSFWLAFVGNTTWALSSLVPLAGPALTGGKFAATAVGKTLIPVLTRGSGAYATTAVGMAGAQLAQWSGGGPASASSMPKTRAQIRDQFYAVNAKAIARLKIEAHALTLEALTSLAGQRQAISDAKLSAAGLESLVKEYVMKSLFWSLFEANGLESSDFSIKTDVATRLASNALLQTFALTHGAIRDQSFSSTDTFGDRSGTEGTASAITAMGGTDIFSSRLQSSYELIVGNINGTLADWGALNTLSQATQDNWSRTNALASGRFSVPFKISDKTAFAARLNGNTYTPASHATTTIQGLQARGGRWMANVLPDAGVASFSSSDYSSLTMGTRTVWGLNRLRLGFVPSGSFTLHLNERSSIEPSSAGDAVFAFTSGNTEAVTVIINPDVAL